MANSIRRLPRPRAVVIGAGRVGSTLGQWLADSHYRLAAVVSRTPASAARLGRRLRVPSFSLPELERAAAGAPKRAHLPRRRAAPARTALPAAELWIIAVPDRQIACVAAALARGGFPTASTRVTQRPWRGRVVLHTSGVLPAAVLEPLRRAGAAIGSLHPLMTFPPPGKRIALLSPRGLLFAVEGQPAAVRAAAALVRRWQGSVLRITAARKPAYHLAASLACPMVVIAFAAAVRTLEGPGRSDAARNPRNVRNLGLRRGLLRLTQQTVENLASGLDAAWTGPLARGDVETVGLHLDAASGIGLQEYYRAAAFAGLRLLPTADRRALERLLGKHRHGD
jgi:predicted short-subunit dehydrogenase-like oxidoreductase (DUF2520 family)